MEDEERAEYDQMLEEDWDVEGEDLGVEVKVITPPPTHVVTRGFCGTGRPVCGQKARLYGAGWRCDEHKPTKLQGLSIGHAHPVSPRSTLRDMS